MVDLCGLHAGKYTFFSMYPSWVCNGMEFTTKNGGGKFHGEFCLRLLKVKDLDGQKNDCLSTLIHGNLRGDYFPQCHVFSWELPTLLLSRENRG